MAQSKAFGNVVKLDSRINVKDPKYGAKGDGTTDDTTALQAAHDAAVTAGYVEINFPAGTYKFTSLNWSPFITAYALGKVLLNTAKASGNAITISDLYGDAIGAHTGRPCKTFVGNFYLSNTNAANTAYALFIGGATNANYAPFVEVDGMFVSGFNSGVIQYGYNSFLSKFYNFWAYQNAGSQISTAASVTNSGENISFFDCIFSGTAATQAGPLIDINNTGGMDINFYGCSVDYLTGLNKTGNTAANLHVSWWGGHMEANMTTTFLQNDSGSTWDIVGPQVTSPTAGGSLASTVISSTTNNGTTRFTKANYVMAGPATNFHNYAAGTKGVVDANPTFPSGSTAPTNFVTQASGALVGGDGVLRYTKQWTATFTGVTTVVTGTIYASKIGEIVTLNIPALTGTSNATTKTITGMPSDFYPARNQVFLVNVQDNSGAFAVGLATIDTGGVITLTKDVGGSAFTNTGTASSGLITASYGTQ